MKKNTTTLYPNLDFKGMVKSQNSISQERHLATIDMIYDKYLQSLRIANSEVIKYSDLKSELIALHQLVLDMRFNTDGGYHNDVTAVYPSKKELAEFRSPISTSNKSEKQ